MKRLAEIEFSKKVLLSQMLVTLCLCLVSTIGSVCGFDVSSITVLASASFMTDGAWGGFYFWKAKNENRHKYAQALVREFADVYGIDAAIQLASVVLKD